MKPPKSIYSVRRTRSWRLLVATVFFISVDSRNFSAGEPQDGWPIVTTYPKGPVIPADIDGDGSAEILVASNADGLLVYDGNGLLVPGVAIPPSKRQRHQCKGFP